MATIDFPEDLIALERTAWEEIQVGALIVETARAVQDRIASFAAEAGLDRYTVEMALKRTVRHPEPAGA